jgi:hypothetical protein
MTFKTELLCCFLLVPFFKKMLFHKYLARPLQAFLCMEIGKAI